MTKPIAKSLHTVTVLVRVATMLKKRDLAYSNMEAVHGAMQVLGLSGMPDTYGLVAAAIKQLSK